MTGEPVTDDLLHEVVRMVVFAADNAVIGKAFRTRAEETRAAVMEAFRCAMGNGVIRVTPRDEWPEYIALSPPYEPL